MFAENELAISDEFSSQVAHFNFLVERLFNDYPEDRKFILESSNQHARNICGMVARFARTVSRDQSYDDLSSLPDGAASTSAQTSTSSRNAEHTLDWPATSLLTYSDNLFDQDLLNEDDLGMVPGMVADQQHGTTSLEMPHDLMHSSEYIPPEQTRCQFETIGHAHEVEYRTIAPHSDSTVNPAALTLKSTEMIGNSTSHTAAEHIGTYASSQERAQAEPTEGGKTPKRTRKRKKTGAHASIESGTLQNPKRRRITSISSTHVEEMVLTKLQGQHLKLSSVLANMYHATASTDPLCQLKDIIAATRQMKGHALAQNPSDIAETIRMLDRLEEVQQVTSFLHRTYLLRLWKQHETIRVFLEDGGRTRSEIGQPLRPGTGTVPSNVLDYMVAEAFPDIDRRPQGASEIRAWREKYEGKRKSLKNRLQGAKKWSLLSERFSCGILALIPFGGRLHITNNRLETLPNKAFEVWMSLLEEMEGNVVYRVAQRVKPYVESILAGKIYSRTLGLESVGNDIFEKSDLSDLIDLCEEVD